MHLSHISVCTFWCYSTNIYVLNFSLMPLSLALVCHRRPSVHPFWVGWYKAMSWLTAGLTNAANSSAPVLRPSWRKRSRHIDRDCGTKKRTTNKLHILKPHISNWSLASLTWRTQVTLCRLRIRHAQYTHIASVQWRSTDVWPTWWTSECVPYLRAIQSFGWSQEKIFPIDIPRASPIALFYVHKRRHSFYTRVTLQFLNDIHRFHIFPRHS